MSEWGVMNYVHWAKDQMPAVLHNGSIVQNCEFTGSKKKNKTHELHLEQHMLCEV